MAKLIILSVVLMSFIVPIYLSTQPSAKKALRKAQTWLVVYIVIWAFMCLYWYPELVPLK
jgi:hypothetical protein